MTTNPTDPVQYIDDFRAHPIYQAAWVQFFVGRRLARDVTHEEQRMVFEHNDAAKLALIAFAERTTGLRYDPAAFGAAAPALERYVEHVRYVKRHMLTHPNRNEIAELDRLRSRYHLDAAEAMVDQGIAPTIKLGRTLARLVLVDLGMETYDDARRMV